MGLKTVHTRTGKIYYDTDKKLEFLTVGDYGKGNNIKASFLGYNQKINGVQHNKVDLSDKWVATISTQKGCPMGCNFCDVPKFGFYGNASVDDLKYQLATMIDNEEVKATNRFNVHYARMGEPSFNDNVLDFTEYTLDDFVKSKIDAQTIHPVISTMMPKRNSKLLEFISYWCYIKNNLRNGEAGLQLSINSTNDEQREKQFKAYSLELAKISKMAELLSMPIGRKYTLNFAVTKDTILDANVLDKMFDREKFIVKLTPIHLTSSATVNGFDLSTTYDNYDVYERFEQPLLELGWDVIVFVPSKEEDEDRITCGNALISDYN